MRAGHRWPVRRRAGTARPTRFKPPQIQFLSAGDGRENFANQFQIRRRKRLEQRQAVLDLFQQQFFGGQTLLPGQFAKIEPRGILAENPFAEFLQRVEPLRERDEFRVGDGVGGAREQVGEADLRAHRRRQHAQRQVKRARRCLEQIVKCLGHFSAQNNSFHALRQLKSRAAPWQTFRRGSDLIRCRRYCVSKAAASGSTVPMSDEPAQVHKAGRSELSAHIFRARKSAIRHPFTPCRQSSRNRPSPARRTRWRCPRVWARRIGECR